MPELRPKSDWPGGRIERLPHRSSVLHGNPWNDPVERDVCVYLPHGFGGISPMMSRVHGRGACDADLIVSREDRISGNAAMHETFVTVARLGRDGRAA